MGKRSRYFPLLIIGLLCLVPIAFYLRAAPARQERRLQYAALPELTEIVKKEPENGRASYYLGARLRDLGRLQAAQAALALAARLEPDSRDVALAQAEVASRAGDSQAAYQMLQDFVKRHPQDAEARWELALFYVTQDDHAEACDAAQEVARLRPEDARAWRLTGTEALQLRKRSEAITALRKAVALDKKDWRALLLLADALRADNQANEAIKICSEAVRVAPDAALAWKALGEAQSEADDAATADTAAHNLEKAIQLDPSLGGAYQALGRVRLRQNRLTEARDALQQAARLAPNEKQTFFDLTRVYQQSGDAARAAEAQRRFDQISAFEKEKDALLSDLVQTGYDADKALRLARLCAANGDFEEASRQYRRLMNDPQRGEIARREFVTAQAQRQALEPQAASAEGDAGRAQEAAAPGLLIDAGQALQAKRFGEAIAAYRAYLSRSPRSAEALIGLGRGLEGQDNIAGAFDAFRQAVALAPDSADAQFGLAQQYLRAGFVDSAQHRLEALLKKSPNNPAAWNLLGECRRINESGVNGAEEAFQYAVNLAPKNPLYLTRLAEAEGRNRKSAAAEKHFRQALVLDPHSAETAIGFAVLLLDQAPTPDNLDEAEQLLKQTLSAEPDNVRALLTMGRLLMARNRPAEAVPFLEGVILRKPQREAWFHLARAYEQLGNRERADYSHKAHTEMSQLISGLSDTVERVQNDPKNAELRLRVARLYERNGDFARAINQYNVYLSRRPDDSAARQEYQRFVQGLAAAGQMPPMAAFNAMMSQAGEKH